MQKYIENWSEMI